MRLLVLLLLGPVAVAAKTYSYPGVSDSVCRHGRLFMDGDRFVCLLGMSYGRTWQDARDYCRAGGMDLWNPKSFQGQVLAVSGCQMPNLPGWGEFDRGGCWLGEFMLDGKRSRSVDDQPDTKWIGVNGQFHLLRLMQNKLGKGSCALAANQWMAPGTVDGSTWKRPMASAPARAYADCAEKRGYWCAEVLRGDRARKATAALAA